MSLCLIGRYRQTKVQLLSLLRGNSSWRNYSRISKLRGQRLMSYRPALLVFVSSALVAASGSSARSVGSDWFSSVTGSLVVGPEGGALACGLELFWCVRPPDLALPLAPRPFLFLLQTKVLMACNRKFLITLFRSSCSSDCVQDVSCYYYYIHLVLRT